MATDLDELYERLAHCKGEIDAFKEAEWNFATNNITLEQVGHQLNTFELITTLHGPSQ